MSTVYYYYAFEKPQHNAFSITARYDSDIFFGRSFYYDISVLTAGQVGLAYIKNNSTYDGGSENQYFAVTDANISATEPMFSGMIEDVTSLLTMNYDSDEAKALYSKFTGYPVTGSSEDGTTLTYVGGALPDIEGIINDKIEELLLQNRVSDIAVKANFKKTVTATGFNEANYPEVESAGPAVDSTIFITSGSISRSTY
tara:strand:- start:1654 stop:2250 length:597 start_codon:yes stop_codon:yes gene_type:complete